MSDAPQFKPFTAYDSELTPLRKPPTLLLSELARTSSGDPEAVGVIAEFFETVLGATEYRRFKKAAYAYTGDSDEVALGEAMNGALESSLETPTQ